ncbi:MAG: glycosyltransferase [Flavobacteriaceae bacterium]
MKTLIHIIPTLQNGGAENVLARLVSEFSKLGINQIVITIQGGADDFNCDKIVPFCEVIHFKTESKHAKTIFKQYPNALAIAWMYKAIYFAYKWKRMGNTQQQIIWNIRHSNFGPNQWYQKGMLHLFGLASHLLKPKIIYCSYKSKEVHEKAFFTQKGSKVIVNRLAKNIHLEESMQGSKQEDYFLFVGRFNPQKGPQHLRNILNVFYQHYNTPKVWIAGHGWDINYFPPSMRSFVKILGNRKDIYALYQNAKALMFTSTYGEGYPNVLVEAAAMGLPIIAFDAGDAKKILANYSLGYNVENEASFYEKLVWLMHNSPSNKDRHNAAAQQIKALDFSLTVKEYNQFIWND